MDRIIEDYKALVPIIFFLNFASSRKEGVSTPGYVPGDGKKVLIFMTVGIPVKIMTC